MVRSQQICRVCPHDMCHLSLILFFIFYYGKNEKQIHRKTCYNQHLIPISEYVSKTLESWVSIFMCVCVCVQTRGSAGHREEKGGAGDTGGIWEYNQTEKQMLP